MELNLLPLPLLALLLVGGSMALAVGGVWLARRLGWSLEPDDNGGAGLLHAFIGVVYAVALGLIVVMVQEEHTQVEDAVVAEANAVGDLYRTLDGWREPERSRLRGEVRLYVRRVVTQEWPTIRRGEHDDRAWLVMDRVAGGIVALRPADDREATLYGALIGQVSTVLDARRTRLFHGTEGIGGVSWGVIVLGGVVTLGFACTFHFASIRAQMAGTAAMAALFGMMIFLIVAMDHPLRGELGVTPKAFTELRHTFARVRP